MTDAITQTLRSSSMRRDLGHVDEVVSFGGTYRAVLYTGLQMARLRNHSDYIHGRIDVEQFEAEFERLMRKEANLRGDM